ncbi:MAG: hypothetical protein V3U75_01320 [Methylococcaceae bacterium]
MPYSLSKLALAGLLTTISHSLGHVGQGNRVGIPVKVNPNEFTETWHTRDKKKALKIHGAGFRAQDELTRQLGASSMPKEASLANAIYKAGYLLGVAKQVTGVDDDIDHIGKNTGSKTPTQLSLIASILSDIHKSKHPDRKWDLGFWQSKNGAPGLRATIKQ